MTEFLLTIAAPVICIILLVAWCLRVESRDSGVGAKYPSGRISTYD